MGLTIFIFLFVYALLCFYVAYNGWAWLKKAFGFSYKKTYISFLIFAASSFFLAQFIPFFIFTWTGYIWLIVFGYSLILFPIFNIIYFSTKKRGIKWMGFGAVAVYLIVLTYGSYNAWSPVVVSYDVELGKESELEQLKVLLISDIHVSETIGPKSITRLTKLANQLNPDIIFLAGDVIDNSIEPYFKHNLAEIMAGLTAPMGVYAVLGNHEYYGRNIPIFIEEMNKINIDVLVDEAVNVDDHFYVVGRKDYSDRQRHSIEALTNQLDKEKPIFLIDHQPREFSEIQEAGVDLMVSGHTHKGQVFPGNLLTKAMYENHYGLLQIESFHSIVSSGFGIWGPPFRIGSRAEIVEINVSFTN